MVFEDVQNKNLQNKIKNKASSHSLLGGFNLNLITIGRQGLPAI